MHIKETFIFGEPVPQKRDKNVWVKLPCMSRPGFMPKNEKQN